MELLNSIMSWVIKKRIHQMDLFLKYPNEVQHELLENLTQKAKNTEYGKKYGFGSITNYEDFKSKVPLVSYEDLYPCIERLMKGEQNILWPTEVTWFAKSSGTTNSRSKFIPVSKEALEDCHFKGGKDMLSLYFNNYPDAKMFTGKGLGIGGSHQLNPLDENTKSYYGDVSAVILQNLPWWAQMVRTPSLDIALMDEWEGKINKMVEVTAEENVTNVAGVPTWTVVLLEKILEYKNVKDITEVWPNIEVFFHGAVAFTPYEDLFKRLIPSNKMRYVEIYNASEGFFGLQDRTGSKDLLLMLDYGIYYEFIPMQNAHKAEDTISLSDVEIGKNYAMVISTNGGLWRYKIGDTVTFTSVDPYRIKITGRTKHFINAFGEELMVENAETAIASACKMTNAAIHNFTAGPRYLGDGKKGGHEWIIEFNKDPDDLEQFTQLLDEKLREINSDYDAKRYKDLALAEPLVHAVPAKTFYTWMKARGKLGAQNKVPRLSNDRSFIEEILQFQN